MKKSNAPAGARTPFQKWVDKYQGLFYLIPLDHRLSRL